MKTWKPCSPAQRAELCEIIEIGFVINAGAFVFDRFPCRQQAQRIEAPMGKACEMFVCFGERERASDEGDIAMIAKVRREIGAAVRIGHLAIAAEIDAAQDHAAARPVGEPASFDIQPVETASHCATSHCEGPVKPPPSLARPMRTVQYACAGRLRFLRSSGHDGFREKAFAGSLAYNHGQASGWYQRTHGKFR